MLFFLHAFVMICFSVLARGRPYKGFLRGPKPQLRKLHMAEGNTMNRFSTIQLVEHKIQDSISKYLASEGVNCDFAPFQPLVTLGKPEHGDYQSNVAMALAKTLKKKPSHIAAKIAEVICATTEGDSSSDGAVGRVDVSGPGFINIHLSEKYLQSTLATMSSDPGRLGIPATETPQRVVVDFSSPNIAKEMHVGHLRSTIIGDSISRVLEFLGHDVLRLNHVGDWGTQFGMLIQFLKERAAADCEQGPGGVGSIGGKLDVGAVQIGDLVELYKAAKRRFDEDATFRDCAREQVVRLQGGDPDSLRAWVAICEKSRLAFQELYDELGVRIAERGESFYNPMLPGLVEKLCSDGVAVESEGALCVFLEGFKNAEGSPLPLIVQKSDGGYLYATTDLAAISHRVATERADRIIYVTDAGQAQHFAMVFKAATSAGLLRRPHGEPETVLQHVPFGLVLGEDGKKIKSRAGDSVKLRELLGEAVQLAGAYERQRLLGSATAEVQRSMGGDCEARARVLGLGAVKYADLSMHRESNYKFSFAKMLSLSGNTAPYMLYAYVRIRGIQRKAAAASAHDPPVAAAVHGSSPFALTAAEETALAKHLVRFHEVVAGVGQDLLPNKLCDFIFELAQRFNAFYENCPVLQAPSQEARATRTQLCALTADTLQVSLGLLGIETVETM